MTSSALPDPEFRPEFYADTPLKRLIAWGIDSILIAILTALVVPFTGFTGLFFLPFLYMSVGFVYRWVTLARWSATPGMAFMAIEFRRLNGGHLDGGSAFLHTLGYSLSIGIFLMQLASVGLMLTTARGQGLTDLILGTVAMNRAAGG